MKALFTRINSFLGSNSRLTPLFIRLGLAVVFMYAAISSTLDPKEWIGFLPTLLTRLFPAEILLKVFSVYELILAAWLLTGIFTRLAGLVCALTLFGIVVSNFSLFAISFRDIGLILAALALVVYPEKPRMKSGMIGT